MLVFHNDIRSPNCLKTKVLLTELGLSFDQIEHDYSAGDLRKPQFLDKFPNAKVPAIEDGDVAIAESNAIALYLAHKHGALIPTDLIKNALMYQALAFEAALLAPTIGGQGIFGELGKPLAQRDEARLQSLAVEAKRVGQVLDTLLRQAGDYFAGDFSIADIQLFPGLSKAIRHDIMGSPALAAWSERVASRPSIRDAMPHYPAYAGDQG